jgi:hypothetical protein
MAGRAISPPVPSAFVVVFPTPAEQGDEGRDEKLTAPHNIPSQENWAMVHRLHSDASLFVALPLGMHPAGRYMYFRALYAQNTILTTINRKVSCIPIIANMVFFSFD